MSSEWGSETDGEERERWGESKKEGSGEEREIYMNSRHISY